MITEIPAEYKNTEVKDMKALMNGYIQLKEQWLKFITTDYYKKRNGALTEEEIKQGTKDLDDSIQERKEILKLIQNKPKKSKTKSNNKGNITIQEFF